VKPGGLERVKDERARVGGSNLAAEQLDHGFEGEIP
jgi:hypothetical protein